MMRRSMTPAGTGHDRKAVGLRAVRTVAAWGLVGILAVAASASASATGGSGDKGGHGGGGSGDKITICRSAKAPKDQTPPSGKDGAVVGDFTWKVEKVKASKVNAGVWDIVPAVGKSSAKNLTTTFNGVSGADILSDDCKINLRSTGLYVYPKDNPNEPAGWYNSGRQVLVASWNGWSWKTELDASLLPEGVCGAGWGVQQDKVWGPQSVLPPIVDRKADIGVLGWPPVTGDLHSELDGFLTVPDCETSTPTPTPSPEPTTPAPTPTTPAPTPTTPAQPDDLVETGEWVDGTWACDATTVERTRTLTTTKFELVDGVWVKGEPTSSTERGLRDLTADERTVCPAPTPTPSASVEPTTEPTPTPSVSPSSEVLAATPSPSPTYTSEVLAAPSGGSGGVLAATGSTVGPVLGGAAVLLLAGAGLVFYRRRAAREDA